MMLDALLGRRMKPSLVIIGAQKAGTTTLFDILAQHPQVIPPRKKEISFFSRDEEYAKGIDHYWSEFPRHPRALGRFITLDASPMYLYHSETPARIARHLNGTLCLAILRDPVDRAYSAWNMYRDFKDNPRHAALHDPRSFEQAVEEELAGKRDRPGRRYLERSLYAPQLIRYLEQIEPNRIVVWRFEDLGSRLHMAVNDLCSKLRISSMSVEDPALRTRSNARGYQEILDPDLRHRLVDYFSEDIVQTNRILDQFRLVPEILSS